jgi:outer membrane protein assembly factor BamB
MQKELKVIYAVILSSFFFFSFVNSEENNNESNIEFIPVYEKIFQDSIIDVIFDTATVSIEEAYQLGWSERAFGAEKKKEVLISYPKVLFISKRVYPLYKYDNIKEIIFLDRDGKQKNKVTINQNKVERVHLSPRKKRILIERKPDEYDLSIQGGILLDSDGKLIWQKDEGPYPIAVNDEGYAVASYFDDMYVPYDCIVYDPQGKEIQRISNPLGEYQEQWLSANFSVKGNYVVIRYTDTRTKSILYALTKKGDILWQEEFDYLLHICRVYEELGIFGSSYDGGSSNVSIFNLDWLGEEIWNAPIEVGGALRMKVLEGRNNIFSISHTGYLWCIDNNTGKILWRHREDWSPLNNMERWPDSVPNFQEFEINFDNVFVIGKCIDKNRRWYSSTLFVFSSRDGKALQKKEYPNTRISLFLHNNRIFLLDIDKGKISSFVLEE